MLTRSWYNHLFTTAVFVIISAGTSVFAGPETTNRNLVLSASSWRVATDNLGSSFKTDGDLIRNGVAHVTFTMTKKTTDEWPYVELVCETGHNLSGVKTLEVTYTCDKPLIIKLSQTDFGWKGNQTYAHYEYKAPPAKDWKKISVALADFRQPDWATPESRNIPFKPENVPDVYFVPELDYNTGDTGTVIIKHFLLCKTTE